MKNDIDVHRTNATIFFMSEYAYRHLWYIHGGQSLFDYVDWLEEIFKEFYGECSQDLLDAFIEYVAMSTYTADTENILHDFQNLMFSYRNLEKFREIKDLDEVFCKVYERTKDATDNAVSLSNEHGVYLTRIRHIQSNNLDPRWNEGNYADIVEYPFLGALVSSKLDNGGVKIFTVGDSCADFPKPPDRPAESNNHPGYYKKVGFYINPFYEPHDFKGIFDIIKFISSLYYFAKNINLSKNKSKNEFSSEVIKNCFSGFYKGNIHKIKIGLDKRINGLRMWDMIHLHNKDNKDAIKDIARSYCINDTKMKKEGCESCCPTQDCYSSLHRDLDVSILSIKKCTVCTTKNVLRS